MPLRGSPSGACQTWSGLSAATRDCSWTVALLATTTPLTTPLLSFLPTCPLIGAQGVFDEVVRDLAVPSYLADGILFGPYYEGTEGTAVYNSSFRPFQSPVPFLFVRHGVVDDWKFSLDDERWFNLGACRYRESGSPSPGWGAASLARACSARLIGELPGSVARPRRPRAMSLFPAHRHAGTALLPREAARAFLSDVSRLTIGRRRKALLCFVVFFARCDACLASGAGATLGRALRPPRRPFAAWREPKLFTTHVRAAFRSLCSERTTA